MRSKEKTVDNKELKDNRASQRQQVQKVYAARLPKSLKPDSMKIK